MDNSTLIIIGIVGLVIGFAIAKVLEKGKASKTIAEAKKEASSIIKIAHKEGENIKKDKILQAKEKFLELKAEHEKVINRRQQKNNEQYSKLKEKERNVSQQIEEVKRKEKHLNRLEETLAKKIELNEKKANDL